jgi:hypothetical protein
MAPMNEMDENGPSAARAVWDELRDKGIFRLIAFLAGAALLWWLRSR